MQAWAVGSHGPGLSQVSKTPSNTETETEEVAVRVTRYYITYHYSSVLAHCSAFSEDSEAAKNNRTEPDTHDVQVLGASGEAKEGASTTEQIKTTAPSTSETAEEEASSTTGTKEGSTEAGGAGGGGGKDDKEDVPRTSSGSSKKAWVCCNCDNYHNPSSQDFCIGCNHLERL